MNLERPENTRFMLGQQLVEEFLWQFDGNEEYRVLACHAALPLALTPELLKFLRHEFLPHLSWVAEVDLLLSHLCAEAAEDVYVMQRDARAYLIKQMRQDPALGVARIEAVNRLLIDHLDFLARNHPALLPQEWETQRLSAMLFVTDKRDAAARKLSEAIYQCLSGTGAGSNATSAQVKAELARLTRMVREAADDLNAKEYEELVQLAQLTGKILADRNGKYAEELQTTGELAQSFQLPGISVKVSATQLVERIGIPTALTNASRIVTSATGSLPPIQPGPNRNDPWKGVFGGLSERNHRRLSAVVEPLAWNSSHDQLEDWFSLRLTVSSTKLEQHPLRGSVQFFLHDSFVGNPKPRVLAATDGSYATYETAGWGAFTAGALADDGQTRLELDLAEFADLPYEFRNPLKELIERAITQTKSVELEEYVKELIASRRTQSQVAIFQALFKLGQALAELGALQFAGEFYEHAMPAARRTNNRVNEETLLNAMGAAKRGLGDPAGARECYEQMAAIAREHQDVRTEAQALLNLAELAEQQGQSELAIQEAEAALALFQQVQTSPTPEWQQARELLARLRPMRLSEFTFQTVSLDARGKEVKGSRRTLTARQFVEDLGQSVALEMVEIPGGTFLMGTSEKDTDREKKEIARYWDKDSAEGWVSREMPQHEVSVESFYLGKFTITQQQWRLVAGWEKVERDLDPNPARFKGHADSDQRPVEKVSWEDAQEFCARLSQKTGRAYRLPSEAEWEYACRAGTATPFAFGETITHEVVNYDSQRPYAKAKKLPSRGETIPVGSLGVANAFGVFDMHGNVWEWCEDVWHQNYEDAPMDGSAWLSGGDSSLRVLRGGSWVFNAYICRSAYRNLNRPGILGLNIGFRVVVSARTSVPGHLNP